MTARRITVIEMGFAAALLANLTGCARAHWGPADRGADPAVAGGSGARIGSGSVAGSGAGGAGASQAGNVTHDSTGFCKAALPTGFCVSGDADDDVTMGMSVAFSDPPTDIRVGGGNGIVTNGIGDAFWEARFSPMPGTYWRTGAYDLDSGPTVTTMSPNLEISGDSRACGTASGWFDVSELEFDHTGALLRFAAKFEQHCRGLKPALRGALNFHATGKPKPTTNDPSVCTVFGDTGFCAVGPYGDPIAEGQAIGGTPADGTLHLSVSFNQLSMDYVSKDYIVVAWTFEAPLMQMLHPGSYPHATGASLTAPRLTIGSCPGDASFEVLDLQYDVRSGTVTTAAVDFSAQCAPTPSPRTTGKLRFHSTRP